MNTSRDTSTQSKAYRQGYAAGYTIVAFINRTAVEALEASDLYPPDPCPAETTQDFLDGHSDGVDDYAAAYAHGLRDGRADGLAGRRPRITRMHSEHDGYAHGYVAGYQHPEGL